MNKFNNQKLVLSFKAIYDITALPFNIFLGLSFLGKMGLLRF